MQSSRRPREMSGEPARAPAPFAGGARYAFFIERTTPPEPAALERWKALEDAGYDVVALVDQRCTTMVGLGLRYDDNAPER